MTEKMKMNEMKVGMRQQALRMSRELNPTQSRMNTQAMVQGSILVPPAITKVLEDADIIYQWLIKV